MEEITAKKLIELLGQLSEEDQKKPLYFYDDTKGQLLQFDVIEEMKKRIDINLIKSK